MSDNDASLNCIQHIPDGLANRLTLNPNRLWAEIALAIKDRDLNADDDKRAATLFEFVPYGR